LGGCSTGVESIFVQAEGRGGGYRSEEGCASDAAGGPASNTWGEG